MRWVWVLVLLLPLAAAQESHGPIEIIGDSDWVNPNSGVRSGSGTQDDPYIISNWRIEPGLLELPGQTTAIHIEGTRAYVVLRDIEIIDPFGAGVYVFESEHIAIQGMTVQLTGRAMDIRDSQSIVLDNIDLADNGPDETAAGILLHQVETASLRNVVSTGGDGPGVVISRSSNVRVEGMQLSEHMGGLRAHSGDDVTILGLEVTNNVGDGAHLSNLTRLTLLDVKANSQRSEGGSFSGRGVVILESSGTIRGLIAQGNAAQGMKIWDSEVSLREGRFLDNGQAGLQLLVPSLQLQNVEAHGNGRNGVEIFAPANLQQAKLDVLQTHDNGGAGLYIQGLDGVQLERLRSQSNAVGLDVRAANNVTLLNSQFLDNNDDGVRFSDVTGGQVVNSRAEGNQDHGFSMQDTTILIRNNTALQNGGAGFQLASGEFRLENNAARANKEGALVVGSTALVAMMDNQFGTESTVENTPGFGLPLVVLAMALVVRRHQVA